MFLVMIYLFWCFLKFFSKKLIILLILEGLMLSSIISFQFLSLISLSSVFFMMVLSIFMVMDSVFGISLLISSSRCSNSNNKMMM